MWLKAILGTVLVMVIGIVAAILYGQSRWQASTTKLQKKMQAERVQIVGKRYDQRALEKLPTPVQQYFRTVLQDGQPLITAVNVVHTGTFNMGESADQWKPFTSTQRVITQRPAFVWDARIHMVPGMPVFVHDAYVAGEGVLRAQLYGLVTVMDQPSTPELAQGELMRFLAEAAWYPTALLPREGVTWEAEDDTHARVTLDDGTTSVTLVVTFDEEGLIRSVRADVRYRDVNGVPVPTPWEGRFWNYERQEGMLIPLEGEVSWLLPEGPKPYWRGQIQQIEYEFTE